MAENPIERESLTCCICLDLLSDPVTIPCGHSYCLKCIQNSWPEERQDRYKCPQCRKRFGTKPVLSKNIMLADIVDQIKKTTPNSELAGPQDVTCDVCTGRKLKAVKSCLQCVVSFCESHLQPHRDVPMLQKHQLVAPSDRLRENICQEHSEVKKLFCRTDQQPVCVICCMDKHKGHDTVFSAAERAQKQAELKASMDFLANRVINIAADMDKLHKRTMDSCNSGLTALEDCKNTFTEITDLMENIQVEVYQHILSQKHMEMSQINELQGKLFQEMSNLKKKYSKMRELANTQEHNLFLLLYPSVPSPPCSPTDAQPSSSRGTAQQPTDTQGETDFTSVLTRPPINFDYVIRAVTDLRKNLPLSLNDFNLPEPEVPLSAPEPITRQELLGFRRDMTLDPNTAHSLLFVSDNNSKVTLVSKPFDYQKHPDEFTQVLCKHGMIGRSYWEVKVHEAKYVCVAVSYKDNEGRNSATKWAFGQNHKSWAFKCDNNKYSFCFDSVQSDILGPVRPVIGVYLDHSAGVLCFYSVSEGFMTLLHKVQTTFTQPVYAGLGLRNHLDSAAFLKLGQLENGRE